MWKAFQNGAQKLPFFLKPTGNGAEQGQLTRSVTVERRSDDLYWILNNPDLIFDLVPGVMHRGVGDDRVIYHAFFPKLHWKIERTLEKPEEQVGWRARSEKYVVNLIFRLKIAPGRRGTEVHAEADYEYTAKVGKVVPRFLVEQATEMALLRLKQLAETGEIATTKKEQRDESSLLGR